MADKETSSEDLPVYEVTYRGVYRTHVPGEEKGFEVKAYLDQDMINRGIDHVFRSELHTELLEGNPDFPNYKRFGKFRHDPPVHISGKKSKVNVDVMGREEMLDFAAGLNDGKGMPLVLELYPTDNELRTAIREYQKDPEGFVNTQNAQAQLYGPKLANKNKAIELQRKMRDKAVPSKAGKTKSLTTF